MLQLGNMPAVVQDIDDNKGSVKWAKSLGLI